MTKKIITLVFILLLTTSCNAYTELSDLGITSMLGLDYQNEEFIVYTTIIADRDNQENKDKYKTYHATGKSLEEAFENIYIQNSKKIYLSHMNLLVITENIIDQQLTTMIKHFLTNSEYRNNFQIVTIKNNLEDLFNQEITAEEINKKVEANLFDIYPVAEGKFDDFIGVVSLKDLFVHINTPDFSLRKIVRPAQFVPENQSVYTTLEQFKQARVKYAIVTDEFGGIEGIVTLKDIMEGLVGQVPEAGEELEIVERADGTWLVDGQYSFYDFLAYFDMEDLYAEHDYNTISGLILDILERLPKTGEKLDWMCFEFEVVDMDGARIDKVLVRKINKEDKETN